MTSLTEKTSIIWAFTPKFECKHSSFSVNSQNLSVNTHIPVLTLIIRCTLKIGCTYSIFKGIHSTLGVYAQQLRVYAQHSVYMLNCLEYMLKFWCGCLTERSIHSNFGVDTQQLRVHTQI